MTAPLLEVRNLSTTFFTRRGPVRAVDDVSFSIAPGEVLGVVGESGSGKSVTAYSILGLVAPPGRVTGGAVLYRGTPLTGMAPRDLRRLRGDRIAMIFQDPAMTLNPVLRIGTQIVETIHAHRKVSAAEARAKARDMLGAVGIPSPEERLDAWPHELSGGMRQRIGIAIALVNDPDLVIADEPTTALDVTIQSQILHLASELCRRRGTAMMWITHDLGVVAAIARRIVVMYAGRIVEEGAVDRVLDHPAHPYTAGLIASLPGAHRRGTRLRPIPGMMPRPDRLPEGCAFRPRCGQATTACAEPPPLACAGDGRAVRCHAPLLPRVAA